MAKEEISENLMKFLKGLKDKKETENISVSKISKKYTYKESIIIYSYYFQVFLFYFMISIHLYKFLIGIK